MFDFINYSPSYVIEKIPRDLERGIAPNPEANTGNFDGNVMKNRFNTHFENFKKYRRRNKKLRMPLYQILSILKKCERLFSSSISSARWR